MITFESLNLFSAPPFRTMTFPKFQAMLQSVGLGRQMIAIGASENNQPVGLILAEIQAQSAKILSLFVKAEYRNQGIATRLIDRIEQALISLGCQETYLVYAAGKQTAKALERVLEKCGWADPEPRMLICRCTPQAMQQASWVQRAVLPRSFEIFPWTELTLADRAALLNANWYPSSLSPFEYEASMEPLNSLGLRYQGEVVGWMITQRLCSDTLCYSCSYIRPDLQQRGRIIPLYAEAINRHCTRPDIPNASWVVPYIHEGMVQFVRHRMADYITSMDEYRRSTKTFPALVAI
ncbi:GNAT family N-acetyltransferase [Leptolyngbya sp. FACHB-17]|uniref:GNAT family N-acetyltransferase n=1 Tax=unclassified Leptolyngbya TaxID=2650499 RepID=UPI0016816300|nr:GNAT family N-acetyltransferase [Leptolyngbya sp. FACHB-17]MBD2078603.1 GNAT family N-acetyltransferase [Leptolyngbya sp. FACHB-17]